MKKIILVLAIFIVMYLFYHNEYNNYENTIRFRVIANSNSSRDILMKERTVKEISKILFKEDLNYSETEQNIYDNLKFIEKKINKLFKNNNYDKNFNISYGMNEFPEKIYKGKRYKKGEYKSLVIEIGAAKGNNYFCILYPSLCTIDDDEIINNKYKYRIKEFFEKLF